MTEHPPFKKPPNEILRHDGGTVHVFNTAFTPAETDLIRTFGEEWTRFHSMSAIDLQVAGDELFDILPWSELGSRTKVVDIGCGSGRWSQYMQNRVGTLDAVDPSDAIHRAASLHKSFTNIRWSSAQAEDLPFADGTFDLALCIGVLHHIEQPERALREAFRVLRPGGLFHVYVYYALEQRGPVFRALFRAADGLRRIISRSPGLVKHMICDLLAIFIYWPLATVSRLLRWSGLTSWRKLPLSFYHNKSFRVMRNDALDRFGTALEERYTRDMTAELLQNAGFTELRFSDGPPYWHAVARRPQ